jgi:NADPH:quinone reductase-like Zn-dependent oxidoreductase
MKAIVQTKYGPPDVLTVQEVEKPAPQDNEVLIKIHATSVTAAHAAMRKGHPLYSRLFTGLSGPKNAIPGTDLSGEIEAVGSNVKRFQVGDQVFGATDLGGGGYAEYVCLPQDDVLALKPANMDYQQAAAILEGATTSLAFLRDKGNIQSGQRVLINGASGGLGTAAVQLAKHFGAHVTGVCSTANVEMVQSLGADKVIDYKQEDFSRNGETYDIIFDTVGKSSYRRCKGSLTHKGVYLNPVLGLPLLLQMLWTSNFGSKKALFMATGLRPASEKKRDLAFLRELVEAGKLSAVVDRRYSLEQAAEAHRYVETGHKKGNIVIQSGDCEPGYRSTDDSAVQTLRRAASDRSVLTR